MSDEKCPCGQEHGKPEDATDAMNELNDLVQKWSREGKITASDSVDIIVALLITWGESQDDPAGAIDDLHERIDEEFNASPEERIFKYVETN